MSNIYLEPFGPPAQQRLGQLIASAKGSDPLSPVTVIAPSPYAGLSLRRALARQGGLVNVRFMPLARLAEYIGVSRMAQQGKTPLSPILKLAAVRHFAEKMATKGPLGDVALHAPLHNYLAGIFDDLSILPEADLAMLESNNPVTQQVVEWYRLYRGLLGQHYDREDLTRAAAAAVSKGEAASVLRDMGFIVFYLAADLSPAESSLISALGQDRLCAVMLGLTGEQDVDNEAYILAGKLAPALGKAESTPPQPGNSGVCHIAVAPDAHEEVRHIIRCIVRDAERGIPFHRMAILSLNTEAYSSLAKNQLEMAGIPVAGPDPQLLSDTPAGKLVLYMLEVLNTGLARESVMRWLAESPVYISDRVNQSQELAAWEAISSAAGVVRGSSQWQGRLDNYCRGLQEKIASGQTDENGEPLPTADYTLKRDSALRLKAFITRLSAVPPPRDGSPWKDFTAWAAMMAKRYAGAGSWPEEQLDRYEKVIEVMGELGEIDSIEPGGTTLEGFSRMLAECLDTASGRAGATGSGVFIAPLRSARGMEFDIVYIPGMAEGAFPPSAYDDAVIPDSLKRQLGDGALLPLRSVRRLNSRREFLSAVAAGQRVMLSYPAAGVEGQRRAYPSSWLTREAQILHQKAPGAVPGKPGEPSPVSSANLEDSAGEPWLTVIQSVQQGLESLDALAPADIHDYDMRSLAGWRASGQRPDRHFLAQSGGIIYRALAMEQGRAGGAFSAWDGNLAELSGRSVRLGIPAGRHFSPTRLELWAKCPFRYFMKYILGIEPLERPEEVMSIPPMERGSMVHTILERFMQTLLVGKDMPAAGNPWVDAHKQLLMELAAEEFSKAESMGITGRPLLWRVAQREVLEDLSIFLEEDNKLRAETGTGPVAIEHRFGFDRSEASPPVVLITGSGQKVGFRGMIDRLDADSSGSRLLVIDYKTGSSYPFKDMKKDPLGAGRHLQLPVYSLAAREHFKSIGEVKAMYWFVSAKGGFDIMPVALADVEGKLKEIVETIVTGIGAGSFPANPGEGGEDYNNCKYCDYRRVCPADMELNWERKSADPLLAGYLRMSGGGEDGEEE
jgi:RecB family exonuclease